MERVQLNSPKTFQIPVRDLFVLLQTVYKIVSAEKPDVLLRMLEMTIHGHKVADDNIVATARQRHLPTRWESLMLTMYSIGVCFDFVSTVYFQTWSKVAISK